MVCVGRSVFCPLKEGGGRFAPSFSCLRAGGEKTGDGSVLLSAITKKICLLSVCVLSLLRKVYV